MSFTGVSSFTVVTPVPQDAGIPVQTGVQTAGQFIVTFPCGYHQGFNCGFNCAEAINFASDRWIDKARHATPCRCISDGVNIDMNFFLRKYRAQEFVEAKEHPELEDDWEPANAEEHQQVWEREQERNTLASERGSRRLCAICREGGVFEGAAKAEGAMDTEDDCWDRPQLVQCKDCLVTVHRKCYGVQDGVDGKDWQCDRCRVTKEKYGKPRLVRCLLCPNVGGAFKQVHEQGSADRWTHVQCALWIPEVEFKRPATVSEVSGLEMIGRDRWDLTCSVCRKKRKTQARGACIQCSKSTCATAYHVTCAQEAGLHIRQSSPLECAESFCGTHDPTKGVSHNTGGIEEGHDVCWGARGFMEGKVRSLGQDRMCQVTFEDDERPCTLPSACVRVDNDRVAAGEEHAQLVRWCDGEEHRAELECEFTIATVTLEDTAGRYIGVLPASSVFPMKPEKKKVAFKEGSTKKRKITQGGGSGGGKMSANVMTPKTKNWTVYLKPYAGQKVTCKEAVGELVWHDDKKVAEVKYMLGGREKVASMSSFEKDAGCRLKNAKCSVKLAENGLTLGQAAAEQATKEGTANVVDTSTAKQTLAAQLLDYGCKGDDVKDWLTGLGLEEYVKGFEKAGLSDLNELVKSGISDKQLEKAGVTKPGHIKKLLFYLKKKAGRGKTAENGAANGTNGKRKAASEEEDTEQDHEQDDADETEDEDEDEE